MLVIAGLAGGGLPGGLPLAAATSAANANDSLALISLVQAIPAVRSRRGPRRRRPGRLHADKGHDYDHPRARLRRRRITPRIAHRAVETTTRLGRRRRVVERSFAWPMAPHVLARKPRRQRGSEVTTQRDMSWRGSG